MSAQFYQTVSQLEQQIDEALEAARTGTLTPDERELLEWADLTNEGEKK